MVTDAIFLVGRDQHFWGGNNDDAAYNTNKLNSIYMNPLHFSPLIIGFGGAFVGTFPVCCSVGGSVGQAYISSPL